MNMSPMDSSSGLHEWFAGLHSEVDGVNDGAEFVAAESVVKLGPLVEGSLIELKLLHGGWSIRDDGSDDPGQEEDGVLQQDTGRLYYKHVLIQMDERRM